MKSESSCAGCRGHSRSPARYAHRSGQKGKGCIPCSPMLHWLHAIKLDDVAVPMCHPYRMSLPQPLLQENASTVGPSVTEQRAQTKKD